MVKEVSVPVQLGYTDCRPDRSENKSRYENKMFKKKCNLEVESVTKLLA